MGSWLLFLECVVWQCARFIREEVNNLMVVVKVMWRYKEKFYFIFIGKNPKFIDKKMTIAKCAGLAAECRASTCARFWSSTTTSTWSQCPSRKKRCAAPPSCRPLPNSCSSPRDSPRRSINNPAQSFNST